jgi:hypothetical protein
MVVVTSVGLSCWAIYAVTTAYLSKTGVAALVPSIVMAGERPILLAFPRCCGSQMLHTLVLFWFSRHTRLPTNFAMSGVEPRAGERAVNRL